MKKADTLTANVTRQVAEDKAKGRVMNENATSAAGVRGQDHIDVINQLFAELELAYHNQYHKAYGQEGSAGVAKKYWLECLSGFSPEIILQAVRTVVKTQEYLPSIATIIQSCEEAMTGYGIPSVHDAYVEACCAPNPKAEQRWSHPAVYLAGKQTGWFELANKTEAQVYSQFKEHYRKLCQRALNGEELIIEKLDALPEQGSRKLSAEENKARMAELRKTFKTF